MQPVFAQALGEYGVAATLSAAAQQLAYTVGSWLGDVSTTTWIVAAVVVLGLVIFKRR